MDKKYVVLIDNGSDGNSDEVCYMCSVICNGEVFYDFLPYVQRHIISPQGQMLMNVVSILKIVVILVGLKFFISFDLYF